MQQTALGRSLLALIFGPAPAPAHLAQRPRSLTQAFEETPAVRQATFEVFKVHLALHTYH